MLPAETITGGWSLSITSASLTATTTTVSSSVNPSTTGQGVTFTAGVTSSGSPVTSGTVTFTEGATTLAANVAVNGSGNAGFTTSSLPEGNHVITATYNGTATFATSNNSVNQRVDNATTVNGNTFCNTGPIAVKPGSATPYPSHISVSALGGQVGKVTAQLKNVSHQFAEDIDALLVGPNGANSVVLVSDAGNGSAATSNVSITFSDTAAGSVPATGAWGAANSSVSARATDYAPAGAADAFPAPAPLSFGASAPTGTATLASAFAGTSPNGTWSLYIVDDGAPDTGSIAGGWCLTVTPMASLATSASGSVAVGGQVRDTAVLSGGQSPTGSIVFSLFGPDDATCSAAAVFTSSAVVVSGNGSYDSPSFTPTAPGTYRWRASYSGDANNLALAGACNAANESVSVHAGVVGYRDRVRLGPRAAGARGRPGRRSDAHRFRAARRARGGLA